MAVVVVVVVVVVIIGIAIINSTSCAQEQLQTDRVAGGHGAPSTAKKELGWREKGLKCSRNGGAIWTNAHRTQQAG